MSEAERIPSDRLIIGWFEKGRERGRHRSKYGRTQGPGDKNPWKRDAWLAGYDFGFQEGPLDA